MSRKSRWMLPLYRILQNLHEPASKLPPTIAINLAEIASNR